MSYRNPTYIQIGAAGHCFGKSWRVIGRVVLGETENGETYYWNEFNLRSDTGESATLVFERTERGPLWRWFTEFTPEYPMTAADAATREVGDRLNLEGTDVAVTFVQRSRIYFIEGEAPEGQHVGSIANYFNAEVGSEMIVVSWTGEEVEYYRGHTLGNEQVKQAFRLVRADRPCVSAGPAGHLNAHEPHGHYNGDWLQHLVPILLISVFALISLSLLFPAGCGPSRRSAVVRYSAPPASISLGATGSLAAANYKVTGSVRQEVAEVNLVFPQQVYYLRDDENNEARLICGFSPGAKDWILFKAVQPGEPMQPTAAAAVKLGQIVNIGGAVAAVDQLFTTVVQQVNLADPYEVDAGLREYGFAGLHNGQYVLALWHAHNISFWRGEKISEQSVLSSLKPPAQKK